MTAEGGAAPSTPEERRLFDALAAAALLAVLGAFLVTQRRLGLTYPVPWPDEGSFLWQALAFRDHGTLFAPELNPTRHVLWMPPAFMVLEGLFFRLVPFSLFTARALSAVFMGGAVACVVLAVTDARARLAAVSVAAVFLFGQTFSLVGNVARMESLVLLVVAAGALAVHHGKVAGLGILAVAPLVHPNGAFAAVAGILYFALALRGRRSFSRVGLAVVAAALALWVAYAVYVGTHWAAFVVDMGSQLRLKGQVGAESGGVAGRAAQPVVLGTALLLVAATGAAFRFTRRVPVWSAVALALLVQTVLTAGWLYEVYAAFAALAVLTIVVDVVAAAMATTSWSEARRLTATLGTGGALAALAVPLVVKNAFITRSLINAAVLRDSREPPYVTGADRQAVAEQLQDLARKHGRLRVQFLPDGEALLFEAQRSPRLHYVQQTFYEAEADILVLHESVWFPPWVHDLELLRVFFLHPTRRQREGDVIRARDGTERWVVYTLRDLPSDHR